MQIADRDISALEAVIDVLLCCDIANEDPYSLCMHNYLQILQPLQLALEYTWDLYSRHTAMHGTTARCLTAASAFKGALQRYAKAAQAEIKHVAVTQISHAGSSQSEQLRAQLRPLKKVHEAMRATLKVLHNSGLVSQCISTSTSQLLTDTSVAGGSAA